MKDAAAAYLPGTGVAGIVCVTVAFIGIIVCLMGLLRPRTNAACVAALLIFFLAWVIECSAHLLVTYAHLAVEWRQRGILVAGVLFAGGLVTSLIGLIGVTRNEHRYDHGFMSGVLAAAGNGWVVAAAITALVNGKLHQLGRGMVLPVLASEDEAKQGQSGRRMEGPESAEAMDLRAVDDLMVRLIGRVLSQNASEEAGGWREVPLGDAQFVRSIDPEAKRLFSTPSGPGWMSLFVRKQDGLTPEALQEQAGAGLGRALGAATTSEIGWRERGVVEGFEVCRAGYVANLPTLPGPHVFDRWLAWGNGWRISFVQWTPSSSAARDFRRRSDSLARTLLGEARLRSGAGAQRLEETELLLLKAGAAVQKKDLATAVTCYREAVEKAPRDTEIALLFTAALEQLRQPAAALAFLAERKAGLAASPAVEAARSRLRAAAAPQDPGLEAEFDRLFDGGLRDDATFATCLALLDARRDPAAATAVLDKWGADHCRAVTVAWRSHFAQAAAAAKTDISAVATPPKPPVPAPAAPATKGIERKPRTR